MPVTVAPQSAQVPALDLSSKALSLTAYQRYYLPARAAALDWNGSVNGCAVGSTGAVWRNSVMRQVNFMRAAAGLPGTVLDSEALSSKAQAAALIAQANQALSHFPASNVACYSAAGAEASGSSNLAFGTALGSSVSAIGMYMTDSGVTSLGHRRWLLYPPQITMGTGDTPQANALWVFAAGTASSSAVAPQGTAWPPEGYLPQTLVDAAMAWSYGLAQADFSAATVTVRNAAGQALALTQWVTDANYGDNTLAFRPASGSWPLNTGSGAETSFDVNISGITGVTGAPRTVTYRVTLFNPM